MMFLLRAAFWASVALALLPSFVPKQASTVPADVGTAEAMTAASETVADLSGFRERRPEACAAGVQFANAFGQRAQAGAKILYDLVGDKLGKPERVSAAGAVARPATGAAAETAGAEAVRPSQNTLTATDMSPPWRGPQHHKDAPAKRNS